MMTKSLKQDERQVDFKKRLGEHHARRQKEDEQNRLRKAKKAELVGKLRAASDDGPNFSLGSVSHFASAKNETAMEEKFDRDVAILFDKHAVEEELIQALKRFQQGDNDKLAMLVDDEKTLKWIMCIAKDSNRISDVRIAALKVLTNVSAGPGCWSQALVDYQLLPEIMG